MIGNITLVYNLLSAQMNSMTAFKKLHMKARGNLHLIVFLNKSHRTIWIYIASFFSFTVINSHKIKSRT